MGPTLQGSRGFVLKQLTLASLTAVGLTAWLKNSKSVWLRHSVWSTGGSDEPRRHIDTYTLVVLHRQRDVLFSLHLVDVVGSHSSPSKTSTTSRTKQPT